MTRLAADPLVLGDPSLGTAPLLRDTGSDPEGGREGERCHPRGVRLQAAWLSAGAGIPDRVHGWTRCQPGVWDKAGAGEHLLGEQFVPPIAFVPESHPPFLRSQLLGGLGGAGAASELDCSCGLSVRLGWEFQVRTGTFPPYAAGVSG